MNAILAVLCLLLQLQLDASELLPSMNYWQLARELQQLPEFADALDVTPAQLQGLKEIQARAGDLKEEAARLYGKVDIRDGGAALDAKRHQVWSKLDDRVYQRLSLVLGEEQLAAMRGAALRIRFPTADSIFADREVQDLLRLTRLQAREIEDRFEELRSGYESKRSKIEKEILVPICNALPEKTRQKLVTYLGAPVGPIRPEKQGIDQEPVPTPPRCNYTGSLYFLTRQSDVELSCEQQEKLADLQRRANKQLYALDPNSSESPIEFRRRVSAQLFKEVDTILTVEQKWQFVRQYSLKEFLIDPELPFSRPEFLRYMEVESLAPELIKAVRMAKEENRKKLRELEARIFDSLAEILSEEQTRKLRQLFESQF
ncbi:MAG: hypothetical protein AB8B50_07010 [Pirellulaceae bacterium]